MNDTAHYIIRIKERNNPNIVETEAFGKWTKGLLISFFGLEEPDVESYTIQVAGTSEIYGRRNSPAPNPDTIIGKSISYHDGFSGSLETFTIDRVEFDIERDGYKLHDKNPDHGFMFLKSENFNTLVERGEYTRNGSIDGCAFREIFKIQG